MPAWGRRAAARLERSRPRTPRWLLGLLRMSRLSAGVAIALVGILVALAAWDGARTGGASPFFQLVLAGFGLHALIHVGQSALLRGYTPGVVTAVLVVAPFGWWAWGRLADAGLLARSTASDWLWLALLPPLLVGAQAAGHGVAAVAARLQHRRLTQ